MLQAQKARLRMLLSHFFQTLNMGVDRGVFQASDRASYQLDVSQTTLPALSMEADLVMWAERFVSGEATRTAAGGTPVPFPTGAEVDAEFTAYKSLRDAQTGKRQTHDKEQEDVADLRDEVDSLIRDVWDEVEFRFRRDQPASLRRKARDYGIVYVARPGEPDEEAGESPDPPAPE